MEKRDRYRDHIPVYTDGLRDGYYVACATVFVSNTVISMRLLDSASIFTAEIRAIIKEIEHSVASNTLVLRTHFRVSIFTIYEAGTFLDWDGDTKVCLLKLCLKSHYLLIGAICSSVVRAFAHGAMGRWIVPSCWTY